jgi:uncharacterized protein (TIGR00251 family)
MKLSVKVTPSASRDGISGWLGDALKIRVRAPPERGKANAAVEKLLARALGLPDDSVHVVVGSTAARKIVEVSGLSDAEVRRRLDSAES